MKTKSATTTPRTTTTKPVSNGEATGNGTPFPVELTPDYKKPSINPDSNLRALGTAIAQLHITTMQIGNVLEEMQKNLPPYDKDSRAEDIYGNIVRKAVALHIQGLDMRFLMYDLKNEFSSKIGYPDIPPEDLSGWLTKDDGARTYAI